MGRRKSQGLFSIPYPFALRTKKGSQGQGQSHLSASASGSEVRRDCQLPPGRMTVSAERHPASRGSLMQPRPTLFKAVLKRAATKKSRNDLIHAEEGEDRFADLCAGGECPRPLALGCGWGPHAPASCHQAPSSLPSAPPPALPRQPVPSPPRWCGNHRVLWCVLGFLPRGPAGGEVPLCPVPWLTHFDAPASSWLLSALPSPTGRGAVDHTPRLQRHMCR